MVYEEDDNSSVSSYGDRTEMFDGPVSQSIPSSISAFPHRRRSSSAHSFRFFSQEEVDNAQSGSEFGDDYYEDEFSDEQSVYSSSSNFISQEGYMNNSRFQRRRKPSHSTSNSRIRSSFHTTDDFDEDDSYYSNNHNNNHANEFSSRTSHINSEEIHDAFHNRKHSDVIPDSGAESPLLYDESNNANNTNNINSKNLYQKFYIDEEDLTIIIAGYKTSRIGSMIYYFICFFTLGIAYLIFRWFPRLSVSLYGTKSSLGQCDWVVIENQWGELALLDVTKIPYNRNLTTVFSFHSKKETTHEEHQNTNNNNYSNYHSIENNNNNSNDNNSINFENQNKSPSDIQLPFLQLFEYRYFRFIYDPLEDIFRMNGDWKDVQWKDLRYISGGIDGSLHDDRALAFGYNLIDIKEQPLLTLLLNEVLHPFYVFQVFSIILWSIDQYYYYAACIFLISVLSVGDTLLETRRTMRRMRELSHFECSVRVLRNGFWVSDSSEALVPGDIFEVSDPNLTVFPCDAVLLSGDVIVNESMLTGESVPVSKAAASQDSLEEYVETPGSEFTNSMARHVLFCGTKTIRVQRPERTSDNEDPVALALVIRTGFSTTKGALVRSMLFPKPAKFKFYSDSFKYIGMMAGIAICGFIISTIGFIEMGLPVELMILRALDLITIVVPPALPATLTIGTNIALSELRKLKIYCISPSKVNVCGKISLTCFDKTGTLTEDGLDVLGVHVVDMPNNTFTGLLQTAKDTMLDPCFANSNSPDLTKDKNNFLTQKSSRLAMLRAMATCHSLRLVNNELIGDPLDFKMFNFTNWVLEEEGHKFSAPSRNPESDHPEVDVPPESMKIIPAVVYPPVDENMASANGASVDTERNGAIAIIRSFDFISELRRMSVIVKSFESKSAQVYVKGAPEIMHEICRPESFPENYEQTLYYYTHKGFRVISCACKTIKNLPWFKAQKLSRAEVESELDFVGFIIFENKLKEATTPILSELRNASIRSVMCTGDNVLTAISVGKECGLIPLNSLVFVPKIEKQSLTHHTTETSFNNLIKWESIDIDGLYLKPHDLKPDKPPAGCSLTHAEIQKRYTVAITGDVFRWLLEYAEERTIRRMLLKADIFARMSPDEKNELVLKFQEIDYCVMFCGDGANDCGALKAADVGISLSDAEASVAAPFTSGVFDISCVPKVIKQGRSALVTSFSCFRFMSLYSAIQFISVSLLYSRGTNLGDFQFLLIDLIIIVPIAIFMAWSKPAPFLSVKRPNANLMSRKVIIPLLGEIFICGFFQFIIRQQVKEQDWYIAPRPGTGDDDVWSSDNTVLFLMSSFQYIIIAAVLYVGAPFQLSMIYNYAFIFTEVFLFLLLSWLVIFPSTLATNILQLTWLGAGFKEFIIFMAFANFVFSKLCEDYIFSLIEDMIVLLRRLITGKPKSKRKLYKLLLLEDLETV